MTPNFARKFIVSLGEASISPNSASLVSRIRAVAVTTPGCCCAAQRN